MIQKMNPVSKEDFTDFISDFKNVFPLDKCIFKKEMCTLVGMFYLVNIFPGMDNRQKVIKQLQKIVLFRIHQNRS